MNLQRIITNSTGSPSSTQRFTVFTDFTVQTTAGSGFQQKAVKATVHYLSNTKQQTDTDRD